MRKYNLALFILFSFVIAWAIVAWVYFSGMYLLGFTTVAFSACMLAPTIAVVLTKLITREGWRDLPLRPRFKGNLRIYLMAWFGPTVMTVLGAAFYFIINMDQFDATGGGALTPAVIFRMIGLILIAPLLNIIFCAGEEIGWRGYLLPQLLRRYGTDKALIFSGLIWGVWHAPMIAMGHNYGTGYFGYPWLGIIAMCIFCVVIGCFLSYLTLKSNSVWPAAIAHGALNGSAALGIVFIAAGSDYNVFIGPMPVGVIGGVFFILAAMNCFSYLRDYKSPFSGGAPDDQTALPDSESDVALPGSEINSTIEPTDQGEKD